MPSFYQIGSTLAFAFDSPFSENPDILVAQLVHPFRYKRAD
jgi:hypothetical protein